MAVKEEFLINGERLNYLLELYRISAEETLAMLNRGRSRNIISMDDFTNILKRKKKVSKVFLNRLEKVFGRGITWYISERPVPSGSIFFRKERFNSVLNLESKKRIAEYEGLGFELEALTSQIGLSQKRRVPKFTLADDPRHIAEKMNSEIIKEKHMSKSDRDYLKNLIRALEHMGIFVFEFVDRSRLPEKEILFSGLFMMQNMIVIKRQQRNLRREIFTLLHEFAHCLLDSEEVDGDVESASIDNDATEIWCNEFSYHFLMQDYADELSSLGIASQNNDFHSVSIKRFHTNTYLSTFAILKRLRIESKIAEEDYSRIRDGMIASVRREELRQKQAIQHGKKPFIRGPKEIRSQLFDEIVKLNYFSGNIRESRLRELLGIRSETSIEEAIY